MGKRKMRKGSALLALSLLALMLASMPAEAKAASKPKLSKKKVTMVAGTKKKLRVKNRNGRKVKWKSSNKKVATVTKSGKVKAKKPGKTVVTATVGKKKLKCKVTVKAGLNKKKVALKKGKSTTLKFTGTKKKVRWKTSNKKVASIKQVGRYKVRVTAKKKGTATITATVAGKKYRCKVTVKKASGSSWPSAKQEKKNIAAATKKAKKKVLALFGGKPEKYSEAERVWKVAKWICDNTGRSYDTAEWDEDEHSIAYKDGVAYSYGAAYSVYIFGRANAQGYSAAFQELLGAVGIEAERVDLEHWTFGANEVRVDGKGYLCCLFRMDTSWVYEHSKKRYCDVDYDVHWFMKSRKCWNSYVKELEKYDSSEIQYWMPKNTYGAGQKVLYRVNAKSTKYDDAEYTYTETVEEAYTDYNSNIWTRGDYKKL